ncbi:CK054 hydrolase, partial [Acromyrmex insinuator]
MKLIPINLDVPKQTELATVLQNELCSDFEEVTVEWVDCPDLTQEPFNLAAPGLCGDTISILDIGGISNLFPLLTEDKIFKSKIYFTNILQKLDRILSDNLIIGGGQIKQSNTLGELIMNASFSPENEMTTVKNKSNFAYIEMPQKKFILESLTDPNPYCNIYGNFFVSKGLREQVLKVHVKHRTGRDFIFALQHATNEFFDLTGFGGTFIVKNGKTIYHNIKNNWRIPITMKNHMHYCIKYREVQTSPMVAFATFVSADRYKVMPLKKIILMSISFKIIFKSNADGGYYHETEPDNSNTEYLGYFSPATKLYCINPAPVFHEMLNFACLRN